MTISLQFYCNYIVQWGMAHPSLQAALCNYSASLAVAGLLTASHSRRGQETGLSGLAVMALYNFLTADGRPQRWRKISDELTDSG
jgi:hypothetical protein